MTAAHELLNLSWKTSDIEASLAVLRRYVEHEAQRQIDWYYAKKIWRSNISRALRLLGIALFVAGGLVPIVRATFPDATKSLPFDFGQAGYLLIAMAAGSVALDRFFGYSTGWIRYITTALALEKSLEEFRMEWARNLAKLHGSQPDAAQLDQLLVTCKTFSLAIKSQVEQETKTWVAEFQSNLAQLEKDLSAKAEEAKSKK